MERGERNVQCARAISSKLRHSHTPIHTHKQPNKQPNKHVGTAATVLLRTRSWRRGTWRWRTAKSASSGSQSLSRATFARATSSSASRRSQRPRRPSSRCGRDAGKRDARRWAGGECVLWVSEWVRFGCALPHNSWSLPTHCSSCSACSLFLCVCVFVAVGCDE